MQFCHLWSNLIPYHWFYSGKILTRSHCLPIFCFNIASNCLNQTICWNLQSSNLYHCFPHISSMIPSLHSAWMFDNTMYLAQCFGCNSSSLLLTSWLSSTAPWILQAPRRAPKTKASGSKGILLINSLATLLFLKD